jgi:predicted DNA binding protein
MYLDNCMIIDANRYKEIRMSTIRMFDFVILKKDDGTYSFHKNRHDGILHKNLTEYQLNELMNSYRMGFYDGN